jgi:hypothetical protein
MKKLLTLIAATLALATMQSVQAQNFVLRTDQPFYSVLQTEIVPGPGVIRPNAPIPTNQIVRDGNAVAGARLFSRYIVAAARHTSAPGSALARTSAHVEVTEAVMATAAWQFLEPGADNLIVVRKFTGEIIFELRPSVPGTLLRGSATFMLEPNTHYVIVTRTSSSSLVPATAVIRI